MSTARSVWVIEQGEYSDYRVVGVFSSRENAERIAAKINEGRTYDKAEVAEWPLDPAVDALNQGLSKFRVRMLRDGGVERMIREDDPWHSADFDTFISLWRRSDSPARGILGMPDVLDAEVWAKDEKHAVKIVNERRLQMIASGEWDTPPASES